MLLESREADLAGEKSQDLDELSLLELTEAPPMGLGYRDHHAAVDVGEFVGEIVAGEIRLDGLCTVHAAHRCLQYRHDDVGDQRDTEAKQRRPRIAQRLDLGVEVRRKLLEGGLDRPTLAVELGDFACRRHARRQIGQ